MVLNPHAFLEEARHLEDNLRVYVCEEDSEIPAVSLPPAYAAYTDVFNEEADTTLPPHRGELNHNIDLKLGCTAPFGPLYNLSEYELGVLKEYLDKNLQSGFIAHSKSPAGALILFIKKKDSSL